MNLEEYIAERTARDPEFRIEMEALQPEYEFRLALIQARQHSGLTQAELAARIGTKQSAIARLETGESRPSFAMLVRLAKALGVTFEFTSTETVRARRDTVPVERGVASVQGIHR
jgi:transcriptional regulator with XRE-family HTH domain